MKIYSSQKYYGYNYGITLYMHFACYWPFQFSVTWLDLSSMQGVNYRLQYKRPPSRALLV